MSYTEINTNRAKAIESAATERAQDEIAMAKQVQAQTGCTWTEALKIAYQAYNSKLA